ncbi:hypothetical protein OUZ56_005691 [Daphnia magna]|uniref:Uncharacterized protein n=1 Tax=Daphnia magna TaxID=35525 RepID=A0ABQ9YTL6_9CRUS|nr:hypothetical protein OUZ56_005691 [Daphnia magna]
MEWKLKTGSYPKYMLLPSDYHQELVRKRTTRESDQATTLVPQKRRALMDLSICGKQENVMMPKVAVISKSSPPLAQSRAERALSLSEKGARSRFSLSDEREPLNLKKTRA